MNNQQLINECMDAELPGELGELLDQFLQSVAALRLTFPEDRRYQLDFAERTLLREVLHPQAQDHHWWQTGLYIIRSGVSREEALERRYGSELDSLLKVLDARLGPYETVSLREIDSSTVSGVCLLSELMTYPQTTFVAPNAYSLAEALFNDKAWYRAVCAGKAPIGFVMLEEDTEAQSYYLWRFMIAPPFQRCGYGAKAIALLVDHVRARPGARELRLSYIDHDEGPAAFYRGLGFLETGEVEEGEVVMRLALDAKGSAAS